jgi:hypothetical protein
MSAAERSIPKSLKGYSPEALKEYGDLEMYNWAFKDLWDHDQARINVMQDRLNKKEEEVASLKDVIERLIWEKTVL